MFDFFGLIVLKLFFIVLLSANIIWCTFFLYQYFKLKRKHRFWLLATFLPMILLSGFAVLFIVFLGLNTP